jgi:hypothetical protein
MDFSDHSPVVLLLDRQKILTEADKRATKSLVEVLGAPASLMSFFGAKPKAKTDS